MITPISDITFSVVPVSSSRQDHARDSGRNRQQDDERIDERSKLRHQDQVDQHDDRVSPNAEALNDCRMPCTKPRMVTRTFAGSVV